MSTWLKQREVPMPPDSANPQPLIGTREALLSLWQQRKCFICDRPGWCRHREREVDLAELEARAPVLTVTPQAAEAIVSAFMGASA